MAYYKVLFFELSLMLQKNPVLPTIQVMPRLEINVTTLMPTKGPKKKLNPTVRIIMENFGNQNQSRESMKYTLRGVQLAICGLEYQM